MCKVKNDVLGKKMTRVLKDKLDYQKINEK